MQSNISPFPLLFSQRLNASAVVRLNEPHYDKDDFIKEGFNHYDIYFDDCSTPDEVSALRGRVTATLAQLLDACAPSAQRTTACSKHDAAREHPPSSTTPYHLPRTRTSAPVKRYFLINQQQMSVP